MKLKITIAKTREETLPIFIYYVIYSGPRKVARNIFFNSIFNREISIFNIHLIHNISKLEILNLY